MTHLRFVLTLVAVLASGPSWSVEILDAEVEKEDGVYHVIGSSIVDASPEFIYATLIDFDNFHKISSGIPETHFVESDVPGEVLAYTRIEACVLWFCRSAEKLERIEATPFREIRTYSIPAGSDFELNNTRWTLEEHGDGTQLTYEAEFKPDFWMPPLISNWAIKRKLIESAENIGLRIEYLESNGITLRQIADPPKE